jgi:membrane protein
MRLPPNFKIEMSVAAALAGFGLFSAVSRRRPAPAPRPTSEDSTLEAWQNILHSPEQVEEIRRRHAASPAEITLRDWWTIAKRVFQQINDHRILTEAAGVTFYSLLALFPALGALISLYGLVADPATVADQLNTVTDFVPAGGMDILHDQLKRLTSTHNGTLSFGAVFGLLFALWSANGGTKSLFDALNIVYDEKEKRSYFRKTLLSLCLTLSSLVFLIIAMAAVVALPVVLNFIGLSVVGEMLLRWMRWPILLVIITFLLAVLYRYGPSRTAARWRWVSWGGAIAAVLWVLISVAFSWYVSNFGSYNKTYGSLGAAIGFMTWIWISSIVVLIGAEIDAEMEHQTEADTTVGQDKPMGQRGATKADQLA